MIQTKTAEIELYENQIVIVRIKPGLIQNIEDAKQNLAGATELAKANKHPILIDITNGEPLEAEVRHYYSGKKLVESFRALALLVDANPLGLMMGNVYFRVARPGIPTQLFTEEKKAIKWLSSFLNE